MKEKEIIEKAYKALNSIFMNDRYYAVVEEVRSYLADPENFVPPQPLRKWNDLTNADIDSIYTLCNNNKDVFALQLLEAFKAKNTEWCNVSYKCRECGYKWVGTVSVGTTTMRCHRCATENEILERTL